MTPRQRKADLVRRLVEELARTPLEPDAGFEGAVERFASDHGARILRLDDEPVDSRPGRIRSHGFPLPMCPDPGRPRRRSTLLRSVREDRRDAWISAWRLGCLGDDPEAVQVLRESLPWLGVHAALSLGYIGDVESLAPIEEAWLLCVRRFDPDDELRSDEGLLFRWTYAYAALAWLSAEDVRRLAADRIDAVLQLFESPERARSVMDLVTELRVRRL